MATYNGHKNWNHWNVSLWIYNDEGLYELAREARMRGTTVQRAAEYFIENIRDTHTPDGARYSVSAVRAAIVDILK
jgi:hypothetical protein